MYSMLWKSTDLGRLFLMSYLFATSVAIGTEANDFQYFSKGIDYWSEKDLTAPTPEETKPEAKTEKPQSPKAEEEEKKEGFSWGQFMDPKNKEFFKEGDYTPPEPFMELVRNPSDENMRNWFAYIEKKNDLSTRLQQKMGEYLAKNGQAMPVEEQQKVAAIAPVTNQNIDPKRYRLRMYFSSTCPHCKRMFGTLSELQGQGFFVEARQIDGEHGAIRSLPFPVELASPDEVKQKNVQSVPLLLIGDLKRKLVYRLTGFQPTTEVLKAIQGQSGGM